ncbi:SET domain-containing protein-lysine N-methyltransferase [Corallococcus sp. AB049A]|uniref:SET domain-containing protein-lysine N-methyltransferase n=1 Tax=Corallococcus interemptor TaxID=2316720 RepID=A0A3A8QJE2_9BACT|nr:SET domain-containing protein-lysine N-methyltransferase [Corallococcus sp. AB050B]RKH68826.1 SET domain-containing protein-lysine N-methyltransferase [Corallococcus interemptor]RKI71372.1 SET domain-containing protein-lysine N-methyltransferase [Corallococcus sp. AB049A]
MTSGRAWVRAGTFPLHPNVEWRLVPGKGRGVFARRFLPKGTLVEWAPISRFPASDLKPVDHRDCQAHHHVFTWGAEPGREKAYAWGMLALYNHSKTPNVELIDGPLPDTGAAVALRDIQPGEELCLDYGITWFEPS